VGPTPGDSAQAEGVARILYKEIVEGDLRKIIAESNDSATGGGARDFRFGDFEKLEPIIRKMFPEVTKEMRRRSGQNVQVEIFRGTFYWNFTGKDEHKEVEFEPPTTARPREGRITRVHEQPCFDVKRIPKFGEGNRVLLLLVQRNDETVWPYFVEESSLSTFGAWDPRVAKELMGCIHAQRPENRAVIGYRDFITGEDYCNGK
jgi:hypothetical protein